ncbi:hypothetical protein VP01_12g1 [Puccinia sorghi]|uniref:Uncharacterized protein n=1 Tax=Puccinia sorghi TaxID=27349 RepID=A0A0L6VPV7_9BASI|nr:hypothetical protein VP01_12g1 [Puccinia sorghi]
MKRAKNRETGRFPSSPRRLCGGPSTGGRYCIIDLICQLMFINAARPPGPLKCMGPIAVVFLTFPSSTVVFVLPRILVREEFQVIAARQPDWVEVIPHKETARGVENYKRGESTYFERTLCLTSNQTLISLLQPVFEAIVYLECSKTTLADIWKKLMFPHNLSHSNRIASPSFMLKQRFSMKTSTWSPSYPVI